MSPLFKVAHFIFTKKREKYRTIQVHSTIFATLKQTRGNLNGAPPIFYLASSITVFPVLADSFAASRILTTVTLFSVE
jgi:hypothetical protein